MRCETFQERLNELLDERGRPSSDVEVTRHAASCPCCAQILRISDCILQAIEPANECSQSLAVTPIDSNTSFKKLLGVITLAAALLISASLWFRTLRVEPALSVSASNTFAQTEGIGLDSPPVSFVHQPIIGLTLLSRADWTQTIDEFEMPFGAQASNVDASWLKAVSAGVIPVQQSMNNTFDLIRRSVSQVVVSG